MVAMGHGFVTASGTMNMVAIMSGTCVVWCAMVWIRIIDLKAVLVHMSVVRMVQMSIMQIINVIFMSDRGVPTIFPVQVVVIYVFVTWLSHNCLL